MGGFILGNHLVIIESAEIHILLDPEWVDMEPLTA